MLRPLVVVALLLVLVHPALAQQPAADKDELAKLRAEVEKLRTQVKELEARVSKLQAQQPKAEEPKRDTKRGKKGNIDLDQIRKLTDRFKGQAGKKGNIDIEQLMKLAEILGNNNVDLSQIMKLMELQKGKKPADKKPEEKKPEEKPQPKLPGGATSDEVRPLEVLSLGSRTPQTAVWQRRLLA